MASTSTQISTLFTLDCLGRIALAAEGLAEIIRHDAPRNSQESTPAVDHTYIDDLAAIADEFEMLLAGLRARNLY